MKTSPKIEAYKTFGGWAWDAELSDGPFKSGGASVFRNDSTAGIRASVVRQSSHAVRARSMSKGSCVFFTP